MIYESAENHISYPFYTLDLNIVQNNSFKLR